MLKKILSLTVLLTLSVPAVQAAPTSGDASQAQSGFTGPRLSEIDILTRLNKSAYRLPYFVEISDVVSGEVKHEYSVPYVNQFSVKQVAEDIQEEWKVYQDKIHWGMLMALNNDLFTNTQTSAPIAKIPAPLTDTYLQNCMIQVGANTQAGTILKGLNLKPLTLAASDIQKSNDRGVKAQNIPLTLSNPYKNGWKNDGVGLEYALAPRLPQTSYCKYTTTNIFPPDYIAPFIPTNVYEEAILHNGIPTTFVTKSYVHNWQTLYNRVAFAGNLAATDGYKDYQINIATSIAKNMPRAILWDGATLPTSGNRSGTTLSPYYIDPSLEKNPPKISQHDQDVALISRSNPLFYLYIKGELSGDAAKAINDVGSSTNKDLDAKNQGILALEAQKRNISAGTFKQQQMEGMASFMHIWQQLDNIVDARPLIYYVPQRNCVGLFVTKCTTTVLPFPLSGVTITGTKVNVLRTNTIGSGSTTISNFRYRYGFETTPESAPIPDLQRHPIGRIDNN